MNLANPLWFSVQALGAAIGACGLAALLLSKNRASAFSQRVAAGLCSTAVMQMGIGAPPKRV